MNNLRRATTFGRRGGKSTFPFACLPLLLLLVHPALPGQEKGFQEELQEVVRLFLEGRLLKESMAGEVEVGHLDPRLKLTPCAPGALEPFLPHGGRPYGRVTVGLRCTAPKPWSLYVPASVRVMERVVVTTRPITRGEPLTAEDLALEPRDLGELQRGFLRTPAQVVGKIARRPLREGEVVLPNAIAAPRLVRRGQKVTIVARGQAVEVRMNGTALADGAEGDQIPVRNMRSRRVVEGRVTAQGIVRVEL